MKFCKLYEMPNKTQLLVRKHFDETEDGRKMYISFSSMTTDGFEIIVSLPFKSPEQINKTFNAIDYNAALSAYSQNGRYNFDWLESCGSQNVKSL